ncbi:MAG: hypothetical protein GWP68_08085, partial [Verrucomicrobiaceae bacterium]|nr:hypothetical protein [Verrucomicrobiaceae bacterium]
RTDREDVVIQVVDHDSVRREGNILPIATRAEVKIRPISRVEITRQRDTATVHIVVAYGSRFTQPAYSDITCGHGSGSTLINGILGASVSGKLDMSAPNIQMGIDVKYDPRSVSITKSQY